MKQRKLIQKVYQACLDHNSEQLADLRREEFKKIFKRRLAGKPFDAKWALVRI